MDKIEKRREAGMFVASMLAFAESTLPRIEHREPKCGSDYGEVKPIKVRINTNRPKKKGRKK